MRPTAQGMPAAAAFCPYKVLGVEPGADEGAIRRAYKKQALHTHPDKAGGSAVAFANVQRAFEAISKGTGPGETTAGSTASADVSSYLGPRLSSADISEYRSNYVGSAAEERDATEAFIAARGDVTKMYEKVFFLEDASDVTRVTRILRKMKPTIDSTLAGEAEQAWAAFKQSSTALRKTLRSRAKFRKLVEECDRKAQTRSQEVVVAPKPQREMTLLERLWIETGDPPEVPARTPKRSRR